MRTVEDAKIIVAEIEARLAGAMARATANETERRRLAFDAATGEEGAKKALAKLNVAAGASAYEIEDCQSALNEAKRRLAEAERAEELVRLANNADAATKLADSIAEHGRRADAAFAAALVELEGLRADINELHRLGVAYPRAEQFNVLGGIALKTAVLPLPLKFDGGALAPRERKTFTELSSTWHAQVMGWASQFIDKAEAA
jgi:hypothetical protein